MRNTPLSRWTMQQICSTRGLTTKPGACAARVHRHRACTRHFQPTAEPRRWCTAPCVACSSPHTEHDILECPDEDRVRSNLMDVNNPGRGMSPVTVSRLQHAVDCVPWPLSRAKEASMQNVWVPG